jgi:hypothetical protein
MSYSPNLARWIQTDPEEYVDGMNLYQPFDSNPVGMVDPSGLDSTDPQSITNPNEADALANQAESDSAYYANLAQNPPSFPVAPPTGPFGGLAIPTQSQDIASYEQLSREYAAKAKAYRKRYDNLMDVNNQFRNAAKLLSCSLPEQATAAVDGPGAAPKADTEKHFIIYRPKTAATWAAFSQAIIGKGPPGTPALGTVSPGVRPVPKPDDAQAAVSRSQNQAASPAVAKGLEGLAAMGNEALNGLNHVDVVVWTKNGCTGYYIKGMNPTQGDELLNWWFGSNWKTK